MLAAGEGKWRVCVQNYFPTIVFLLLSGEADPDTYDQDQFDEDEATELKNASQLKKEQQLLAASGPYAPDANNAGATDALDLGDDYDDEDEEENDGEGIMAAV